MFSLQKLFGKDDRFFTLMEGSAEESRNSILSILELLRCPEEKRSLNAFVESRRNDKRLTKELTEHLCKTFVTPLEREDIEALSHSLYKIPKTAEKFGERLLLAPMHVRGLEIKQQLGMLEKASEIVVLMVKELRKGVDIEKVQSQNEQLQEIEGEADKLMLESLRELYNGDHSALHVVVHKDLFELLEKVFDRCRDVGNIVFQIVLKHS
jgi:uncharacterized protein Yka (UPF0111/DUF47 family)